MLLTRSVFCGAKRLQVVVRMRPGFGSWMLKWMKFGPPVLSWDSMIMMSVRSQGRVS